MRLTRSVNFPIDLNLHQIIGPELHITLTIATLLTSESYPRLNLFGKSMKPCDAYI